MNYTHNSTGDKCRCIQNTGSISEFLDFMDVIEPKKRVKMVGKMPNDSFDVMILSKNVIVPVGHWLSVKSDDVGVYTDKEFKTFFTENP